MSRSTSLGSGPRPAPNRYGRGVTRPWTTLATVPTAEGPLELRRRGEADFLIVIGGRVLMNSYSRSSEEELSRLGLAHLTSTSAPPFGGAARPGKAEPCGTSAPRVLIGGLGMAFTLRAALDVLPPRASVVVVELNPVVVDWCKGPLGEATRHAVDDPRVRVELGDVARAIASAKPGAYDAILLDLYEGPNAASQRKDDPFYGPAALARAHAALASKGALAVWAEDADAPFAKRFAAAGFDVTTHSIGRGGRRHIVYLGKRVQSSP